MELTLGTQIRNPSGMPGLTASEEEWRAYREQQALDRMMTTNNSGMTPQGMEAAIGMGTNDSGLTPQQMEALMVRDAVAPTAPSGKDMSNPGPPMPNSPEMQALISMAFPEAFLKQPPAGVVNTTGGADRVNARTAETGARAITDAKGHVTLTNINPDGSVNKGTGSPNSILGDGRGDSARGGSVIAPDTPIALNGAMSQLQGATSLAAAQGIMMNVNTTVNQQMGKLNQDALTFAANKVGIPALEAELAAVKAQERADPRWFQGIGDSTAAIQIRNDLQAAHAAATGIAQKYLQGNTQFAALKSMEENAKLLFENIKTKEQYRERRGEIDASRKNDAADRNAEWERRDKINEEQKIDLSPAGTLSAEQINRVAVLAAGTKNVDGTIDLTEAKKAAYALYKQNPKAMDDAMNASTMDLPALALAGNKLAMQLTVATERKNDTSLPENYVEQRMANIKAAALRLTDDEVDRFKLSGFKGKDKTEADAQLKASKASRMLNPPRGDQLKALQQERFAVALDMERAKATGVAFNDANTLFKGSSHPLAAAIAEAVKTTGKASLPEVFVAYKNSQTGVGALVAAKQFNAMIDQALGEQKESIFGMPNGQILKTRMIEAQRSSIMEFLKTIRTGSPTFDLGIGLAAGTAFGKDN